MGKRAPLHAPLRGLAQGCRAAKHRLALLMLCWREPVQSVVHQEAARDYVNDRVVRAVGPEAAALVQLIWPVPKTLAGPRACGSTKESASQWPAGRRNLR